MKKLHVPNLLACALIVLAIIVAYHFFHSATAHSASA